MLLFRDAAPARSRRRAGTTAGAPGQGQLRDAVHISERPAEADDRAVPGHWEGDLLLGRGHSGIAALVERTTHFVILIRLPHGRGSEAVLDALAARIRTLPRQLVRSLTWDQGKEMARHAQFTIDTGVPDLHLRSAQPLATGDEREHQRLAPSVLPQGHRLQADHPGAAQRRGRRTQRTASTDAGLAATVRAVRHGCCVDPLRSQPIV